MNLHGYEIDMIGMYYHKIFWLITILTIHISHFITYSNYTLYRGIPVNDNHLSFFKNLSQRDHVSFWKETSQVRKPVDFVVGPDDKQWFLKAVDKYGLYVTTLLEDVQKAFDKQTVKPYISRRTDTFDWQNFFKVGDIYKWLNDLSKTYPKQVKVWSIGKTYEYRDIVAVKIVLSGAKVRSKIIIEGGIHAREWVSPAFVTYMINEILHARDSSNEILTKIALSHEWYFIPVMNPDGYEYTHTHNRLWRKNRHNGDLGVDINRNFLIHFGGVGVSKRPRSDIYCGLSAFSEKESRALRDFVHVHCDDLEFYFSFHSYGQFMIMPYAYTKQPLDNFYEMKAMVQKAAVKIKERFGTKYNYGNAYETVGYLTSGVSGCWVKKQFRVPYVVTFELRDQGKYGFALPAQQILPTCQETLDGVLSIIYQGTNRTMMVRKLTSGQIAWKNNALIMWLTLIVGKYTKLLIDLKCMYFNKEF